MLTAPTQPIPASLFDLNILFNTVPAHPNASSVVNWPAVPFYGARIWHSLWFDLEPQKAQWQFNRLDKLVNVAQQHNSEIVLMLAYSPDWASSNPDPKSDWKPGTSGPLRDMNDWRDYVRTVGTRYKGKIHVYEIWNEAERRKSWTGDMATMVQMVAEASKNLKQIDPSITVVSPAPTFPGLPWLTQFLQAGGGKYVDVIGYHLYTENGAPPEAVVPMISQAKAVMAQYAVGDKPLWNTEAGWNVPRPFPSDDLASAYVARMYILNWAAGVSRFYWYCWDNHDWTSLELTMPGNVTLRPAGNAYAAVQKWLVGASMKRCLTSPNNDWVCELNRDGAGQFLVWNTAGDHNFRLSKDWHVSQFTTLDGTQQKIDGDSVPIGVQPILIQ